MSFFFVQRAREAQRSPKSRTSAPLKQQNIDMLHRLGCKACPLDQCAAHTPKMQPTFGTDAVYFLAEAPGRDEDENTGRPLTGPSGSLLRKCFPDDVDPSFDNVINCRPPNNRTPQPQEIECCRPRTIKHIEKVKPKLIVTLGAVPLHAMTGLNDLAALRGRLFATKIGNHACWLFPTYHPSFVLHKAKDRPNPLNTMYGHCLRMDIEKAYALVDHLNPPQIDTSDDARADIQVFEGGGGLDKLLHLMAGAKSAKVKAIDLETRGLRPYSEHAAIMSAAISFNGGTNFAFGIDHPQALWSAPQKKQILAAFADLIKDDTTKIAHNAPFEIEWLAWQYGPEIVNHLAWECTMMQAHFLDERTGSHRDDDEARVSRYQGLDFLIHQHFGLSFKQAFKVNKKDMSKTDLKECLTYNAADTKYTLRLYHRQKLALGTNGDRAAYRMAVMQQPTVALMQHLGVSVDQAQVKQVSKRLGQEIEAVEYNIQNMAVVKDYCADHKDGFNPGSNKDVLKLFKNYLKRPEVLVTAEHGAVHNFDGQSTPKNHAHKTMRDSAVGKARYSVDKHVLAKIDHPLAKLMTTWRNRTKLKSTYVDGLSLVACQNGKDTSIYPDGLLHTSFNTTATETGRLSSDGPNMQNYPKRNDAWVRAQIVPPKGHVMVAIDYGQLEACTGAMCSKDLYLTKALWVDYDIHMEWAKLIAKLQPRMPIEDIKQFRSIVKNKFVFPAFYGASSQSITAYLTDGTGYPFSEDFVDDVLDKFWSVLSGMKSWQDKLVRNYYENGYVTTLGGRKHRYPLNVNQVINHPFQGTAAELVSDAMNRLSYLAKETGEWYLHPILNIHDDLSFFVPDDDKVLEKALRTIMKQMMVFDFPWINVPLSLEVSVGPNWYDLKPLGKFFSHHEFGFPAQTRQF